MNYFRYREGLPYHLSVGAVIVNDKNEVLCHHFKTITVEGQTYNDFNILMRETLEPGESLEQALHRGCEEEMGAKVAIEDYLGPIVARFHEGGFKVEKTTLYFKCKLLSQADRKRDRMDPEIDSELTWQPIDQLIERMTNQGELLKREDLDESSVLRRLQT